MVPKQTDESDAAKEYEELVERVKMQPGLKELSEAYGYYESLLKQTMQYLVSTRPQTILSTSSSS